MVGNEVPGGGGPAELTGAELTGAELTAAELAAGLRAGYDAAAGDWAEGAGPMYAPLARALVAAAPVPLAGRLVLDLGAGGGVAGQAALAAGARQVVGVDLSEGMLRHSPGTPRGGGWRPVAADAVALPFRDGCFDLVLAAFCLNHLSSLAVGLAEARRVGAAIAASTFAPGWTHPAKDAADGALRSFGYRPPAWYAALAPGSRASDPGILAESAAAAGFTRVQVRTMSVPTGLATPAELVSWRLGMAHVAPFVRSLDAAGRAAVRRAAEQAVAAVTETGLLVVSMVVLTARLNGASLTRPAQAQPAAAGRPPSRRSASRSSPSA
jgi:SAM-dependent methyltransferase